MRNLHKYEEIFPDEFEAEMERSPIIYISFAPVEYHGPHGGLGMDLLKGYDICLRAAEISGGIVYPVVPVAPPGNPQAGRLHSPSVFISFETCDKLFRELLEVFAEYIGFKVCVIMGSHGPAGKLAREIAGESGEIKGMKVLAAGSSTHNRDLIDEEYGKLGIARTSHGGMWESAMLMASSTEFVDPEKIKGDPLGPPEERTARDAQIEADYEEISKVSVEFGEKLVQTAAERIAAGALELLGR